MQNLIHMTKPFRQHLAESLSRGRNATSFQVLQRREGGKTVVSAPPEKQKTCRDILNDNFSDAEWDDLMSDGEPDRNMSGTAESAPRAPKKKRKRRGKMHRTEAFFA